MFRYLMIGGALLALASCGAPVGGAPKTEAMVSAEGYPAPAPVASMAARERFDAPIDQDQGGGGQPPQQVDENARQIAYTYMYGFRVPTQQMEGLMNAQKSACESAGPAKCYVVSSNISGLGQDSASGVLELKASAEWVASFKTSLADSLKPFGAELDSTNQTSEDLTTQIIDTTARLNSKKTLRDRLQALLKERPGKLSELLDIERELANTQGEIDSTESILAAMKLRVAMSTLTLSYQPKYSAVSQSIWRPLSDAVSGVMPNIVGSLAWLVELSSSLLVPVVILGGLLWALLAWMRRGRRKPKPRPAAAPVAPPAK